MEKSDWAKVIADNKVDLPKGEVSIESYAENLRDNIEKTFPTKYLLNRVIKSDFSAEMSLLSSVDATLKRNGTTIESAINTEIGKDLEQVLTFANTYRHLGVVEIVNDKQMDVDQKKNLISQRLSQLDAFYKDNPNLDLHQTNFLAKDSGLNWGSIEESERPRVKKQAMAYQRTLTLADDYEASRKLLGKGFSSRMEVASVTESEFLETSGLDLEKGREIYGKAQEDTIATINAYQAIFDAERGLFKNIRLSNQKPLVNDLRDIDGYDDLFGSQNYCHCEHCRSVLSPAAYFVDLMYFVQEHISNKVFILPKRTHPLYLKNRRPDLWNLKLTCQNTDTEIPYLEIVNDVLEQYIIKNAPTSDVYDMLHESNLSCTLPFNLPLEELRLYLSHFELSLYDIYKLLKESQAKQQREKLKISDEELLTITTSNPTEAWLRFGKPVKDFDVQEFLRLAGITRQNLDDLLRVKFLPEIAQVEVKTIKGDDIQQYTEVLQDLTNDHYRLDLISRFIRLWKKTTWTIREFDMVLIALKSADLLYNLEEKDGNGDPKILQVAELIIIQQALNLSVEETCVMVGELPDTKVKDNQKSLYERLFDLEKIFGVESIADDGMKIYKSTATLLTDRTQDKITPLLLAGLGITESELEDLLAIISSSQVTSSNPIPANNVILLSKASTTTGLQVDSQASTAAGPKIDKKLISDLFRHVRIAKGLKLSIEDLINSIKLCLNGTPITQLSDIHTIIEFTSWVKSSPFTISELIMILCGEESRSVKYQNDVKSAENAVPEMQKLFDSEHALLNTYLQETYSLSDDQLNKLKLSTYTISEIVDILLSEESSSDIYNNDIKTLQQFNPDEDLLRYIQKTYKLSGNQLKQLDKLKLSNYTISEIVDILQSEVNTLKIYSNDIKTLTAGVQQFNPDEYVLLNTYLQKAYSLSDDQLNKLKLSAYKISEIKAILDSEKSSYDINTLTAELQQFNPDEYVLLNTYLQKA
ncbi:MAG: Tc toxin subunit A, partial [Candidatus Poribacteria bacterium]